MTRALYKATKGKSFTNRDLKETHKDKESKAHREHHTKPQTKEIDKHRGRKNLKRKSLATNRGRKKHKRKTI